MSTGPLRRLGKYELVARIGEGGMAEVHLARQSGPRQFEKMVVVKTVRPALASRPELAIMLLEEARIAALVKHANVVDIYDLGEENGTFFIAMEYLEGESLSAVLRASRGLNRLDPFSTARIIADCAAGLHAAHELHSLAGDALELVHQDVTPGNVIVLYTGAVKLVDFGVARVRTSVDDGLVKGKTGYLAPELLDGSKADRRSDIWSLGVVLWEALTLRRLFHGKTEEEAIARIRSGQIPPPSSLAPATPRDLDEVCFQALARDPAKRYRTAASMQADLNEILRHASWSGGTEPIGRFMRGLFTDRIDARKQLIRELATGRMARMTTLERLNASPEDASPADVAPVIGSHGTAPGRPEIARPPAPAAANELAQVQVLEMDDDADALRPSTPTPTGRIEPVRRRRAIAVAAGVMVLAVIGVAFAMSRSPGESVAGAPDAGVGGRDLAAAAPLPALDAAPEPEPIAAVDLDPAEPVEPPIDLADPAEPEPVDDPKPARDRRAPRPRHDDSRRTPREPGERATPAAAPATAKSLYKEGLRTFVGGDVAGAIALFDRARAKDARYAPTYRGLGMAYERRGDRKRAARAFAKYLDLAPDAADAAGIAKRLERLR